MFNISSATQICQQRRKVYVKARGVKATSTGVKARIQELVRASLFILKESLRQENARGVHQQVMTHDSFTLYVLTALLPIYTLTTESLQLQPKLSSVAFSSTKVVAVY